LAISEINADGRASMRAVAYLATALFCPLGWVMAGTITALRFQKRNKNRVNVYLDGKFALGLAAIEAAHLRVGQLLGDDDIARLRERDDVERAFERMLNFLSYRPRSEAEVRRNLRKKNVDDEVIDVVIERLTRAGMLDDQEFARYWVENRLQFKPRGAHALSHELWEKGVPASIIADTLDGFDEETAARKAAHAGARRLAHLEPRDFRRRLGGYLARRGFSYAVISPLVEEMLESVHSEAWSDIESEE
jgi:regulatory protein